MGCQELVLTFVDKKTWHKFVGWQVCGGVSGSDATMMGSLELERVVQVGCVVRARDWYKVGLSWCRADWLIEWMIWYGMVLDCGD